MDESKLRKSISDIMLSTEILLADQVSFAFGPYKQLVWLPGQKLMFRVTWEIDADQPRQFRGFDALSPAITFYMSREPNES